MRESSGEKNTIQEILEDLETKLAAYVDDWWQELGIREGSGASIDRRVSRLVATEREKQRR
jgi:hypothetical protein